MTFIIRKPITNVGSSEINDGSIVNLDINASAAIDATKIHDGSVSNTEFGYLNGVTSSIQTQLNSAGGVSYTEFTPSWSSSNGGDIIPTFSGTNVGVWAKLATNFMHIVTWSEADDSSGQGSGFGYMQLTIPNSEEIATLASDIPFGGTWINGFTKSNMSAYVEDEATVIEFYQDTDGNPDRIGPSQLSNNRRGMWVNVMIRLN